MCNSSLKRPESLDLPEIISRSIEYIESTGGDFSVFSERLNALKVRWEEGRFHLAVLGQFKRGKSSLLNALLGEAVLPTAVLPLTAIPTFIRSGEILGAAILFQDERDPERFVGSTVEELTTFLSLFVTESGNPQNRLGVSHVEMTHPAEILKKGVALIDTPGIGSTYRHNTEATLNFLPQCDAALFLVSADPPLTEVEVEFLKQVRTKVPRLFFILNKVDYLSLDDREAVLGFLRKMLVEQVGIESNVPLFSVSAKQGLESRKRRDGKLWGKSGMEEVENHLVKFLAAEKSQTLHNVLSHRAADLISDMLMRLRLEIHSLQMPLTELEERVEIFEKKIQEIQLQRQAFQDLLSGDQRRTHEFLEQHSEQLRRRARSYLEGVVKGALEKWNGEGLKEEDLHGALSEAIPGYFEHQAGAATNVFRKQIVEVVRPHQEHADGLIETIRRTAAELFDVPYAAPKSEEAFEMVSEPYWVTYKWAATLSPIPKGLIDGLLSEEKRRRRILKRMTEQIDGLVVTNVEHLRWAIYQSIDATFRRFASTLDERLTETIAATHGAIKAAMTQRRNRSDAVSEDMQRLDRAVSELTPIHTALTQG